MNLNELFDDNRNTLESYLNKKIKSSQRSQNSNKNNPVRESRDKLIQDKQVKTRSKNGI